MTCEEICRELPFSREQIQEIGTLLSLKHYEQSCHAAISIYMRVELYRMSYITKKKMGSVGKIRSKLSQISAAALLLSNLLSDETVCDTPLHDLFEILGHELGIKGLERKPLWRDKSISLEKLQNLVADVASSSSILANNDNLLRGYYFLPPRHEANNNLVTSIIWPSLFTTWEQHGRQVAGSATGTNKLHRFVNLVHEATGLGKPSLNTLNRAIQRWKLDPRRDRADNDAWYFGNLPGNTDAMEGT
ncbi:hypothetical protein [Methylobacterium sp. CM6246]